MKSPPQDRAALRFQRELSGVSAIPKPGPKNLPVRKIDDLDPTLGIRNYTILGERTTPPFGLITIQYDPYAFHRSFEPIQSSSGPNAAITYWTLDNETGTLHKDDVTSHTPPPLAIDLGAIFTAWDNVSGALVQVLLWVHDGEESRVAIEFRYKDISILIQDLVELPDGAPGVHACFGDLPTAGVVKLLVGGKLWLFEPDIGKDAVAVSAEDTIGWKTLNHFLIRSGGGSSSDGSNKITARVRVVDFELVARAILWKVSSGAKQCTFDSDSIKAVMLPPELARRAKPGSECLGSKIRIAWAARELGVPHLLYMFIFVLTPRILNTNTTSTAGGKHWKTAISAGKTFTFGGGGRNGMERRDSDSGRSHPSAFSSRRAGYGGDVFDDEDEGEDDGDDGEVGSGDDGGGFGEFIDFEDEGWREFGYALSRCLDDSTTITATTDTDTSTPTTAVTIHDCEKHCGLGAGRCEVTIGKKYWPGVGPSVKSLRCEGLGMEIHGWSRTSATRSTNE